MSVTKAERILPEYEHVAGPELSEAVHQALGAASVCWSAVCGCAGEFDSERACQIGEELIGIISQFARDYRKPVGPVPDPELHTMRSTGAS